MRLKSIDRTEFLHSAYLDTKDSIYIDISTKKDISRIISDSIEPRIAPTIEVLTVWLYFFVKPKTPIQSL